MPQIKPTIDPINPADIIKNWASANFKKGWSKLSTTERVKRTSKAAKARWAKMTHKQRLAYFKKIGFGAYATHTKKTQRKDK